jgi:hypothetical protein
VAFKLLLALCIGFMVTHPIAAFFVARHRGMKIGPRLFLVYHGEILVYAFLAVRREGIGAMRKPDVLLSALHTVCAVSLVVFLVGSF